MSSPPRPTQDPGLFDDLPLQQDTRREPEPPPAPQVHKPRATKPPEEPAESLPLFTDAPASRSAPASPPAEVFDAATRPAWRPVVPFPAQISAGLIDLGIVLAVGIVAWLGLVVMGVQVDLVGSGFLAIFLLPFSFLYQIFPLAFWGRTPGMARVGLVARGRDGKSLSFSQAVMRWLASLLTVGLLGLPWILTATTGRSLADRLSDSQTLPAAK
jgi:uncharacterized RDD family membrane protein YckC